MENEALKLYFETFNEFPFLLTTQDYDDDDYKFLMLNAVNKNKPLTKEDIIAWFHNDFDLITKNQFSNFKKPIN